MDIYTTSTPTISNKTPVYTKIVLNYNEPHMKPEIEYLVVADHVILEKDTNKTSIIGIFQGINIPKGLTSVAIPLTVFARIKGVNGIIKAKVSIIDPSNTELLPTILLEGTVDKTFQIRATFALVNFTKEGKYKIRVSIDDKELEFKEEHSIEVKKQ